MSASQSLLVYVPAECAGSKPDLTSAAVGIPDIHDRLQITDDLQQVLQVPYDRRVAILTAHHEAPDLQELSLTFRKILVHVPEPSHWFGDILPKLDHPQVELILSGSSNVPAQNLKLFRIENFFGELQSLHRHNPDRIVDEGYDRPKPYYFDALLGHPHRLPRKMIYDHLTQLYPGKNLATLYHKHSNHQDTSVYDFDAAEDDHYLWPDGIDWSRQNRKDPFFAGAMVWYHNIWTSVCFLLPMTVYRQTAYSIVAETTVDNRFNWYTEKTGKPLLGRRLFVAFAGQHHLRNLRAAGFRTFHGIIDETYDSVEDPDTRWKLALGQVDWLMHQDQGQILAAARSIVDHNYQLMIGTNWAQQANDLLINRSLEKT